MRISLAALALAAIVELPSYPAFIHRRVSIKSRPFNNNNQIWLFDESLFEAEEAAAVDAHDVSDAGMEAAAMEMAVIIAADLKEHPLEKEKAGTEEKPHDPIVGKVHMLPRKEEDAELLDAEDAAAYDAHDVSDAGMEGAAMERAVIMAEELKEQACSKTTEDDTIGDDQPKKTIFGRIKSLLCHEDDTDSDDDLHLLEANYAHDLSDAAALDHAKEITFSVHDTEDEEEALNAVEAETNYAHDLSDAAALEHVRDEEEARIASVEEHYKSIDKDIKTIEHLIQEADKYDHSEVSKDESNNDLFLILM